MPSIIGNGSSVFYTALDSGGRIEDMEKKCIGVDKSDNIRSKQHSTPQKRRLRSESEQCSSISTPSKSCSPKQWKSPRKCISSSPSSNGNKYSKESENGTLGSTKSPRKRLSDSFPQNSKLNPKDPEQMRTVKEVLHVSTAPSIIMCREDEQKRVLEFCKACIKQQKAGSLYACGCPGTGKTLSMEKVRQSLLEWVKEEGFQSPDVLALNCTSLANTNDIFSKIFEMHCTKKKINGSSTPRQYLQNLFSQKQPSRENMMLLFVDELDYLITKDGSVLHDIFMLTTFPFSRLILIGIANALDLADRFLPKLQSLNCKPVVITFRAYSKDQILKILQQRLMVLPYTVFQPQALELCARKVAAVSGDMRKALSVCRSAIEMLESELRDPSKQNSFSDTALHGQVIMVKLLIKQELNVVRVDHMAIALSKTFKSAIVDTIQSLPQHQQMILCSVVKLFRNKKKDTTVGELNKSYLDICKSALIPPSGILEFSNMCRVLSDQGLLKLGQSREDRLKRVTLTVDEADITFALQGIRFFRNCLQ